jgi:hypothetical protein
LKPAGPNCYSPQQPPRIQQRFLPQQWLKHWWMLVAYPGNIASICVIISWNVQQQCLVTALKWWWNFGRFTLSVLMPAFLLPTRDLYYCQLLLKRSTSDFLVMLSPF